MSRGHLRSPENHLSFEFKSLSLIQLNVLNKFFVTAARMSISTVTKKESTFILMHSFEHVIVSIVTAYSDLCDGRGM